MCNYIKFETGRNLLPVLKIVLNVHYIRCVEISRFVNVAKSACEQCSIFGTV